MAEALGIVSGAAGLVSLGITLCQGLLDYYGSWKDADNEVLTTYNSIEDLTKMFLLMTQTLASSDLKLDTVVKVEESIALCKDGIATLQRKLYKVQRHPLASVVGPRSQSQVWKLLYPFKKSTLVKMQEIVGDLRDNLHIALTVLGMLVYISPFNKCAAWPWQGF